MAVVQVLLAFAIAKFQLFPQVEDLQIKLNETLADNIASTTERALKRPMQAITAALAQMPGGSSRARVSGAAVMQQLADSSDAAESVYVLDPQGRIAAVTAPRLGPLAAVSAAVQARLGLDLSQSEIFRSPLKNTVRISQVYLSAVTDQAMVAITGPLDDGGLLVMEVNLTRLGKGQNGLEMSNGVQILIVDNSGQIIADHTGAKSVQSRLLPVDGLRMLEMREAGVMALDGERWFASSARISVGVLNWRVVVMRPEQMVYEPIFTIVLVSTLATGMLLAFAFLLLMLTTRSFAKATESLSADARALEAGQSPAPRAYRVRELAELDTSLRAMTETLRHREELLKENNEALEQRVVERTQHLIQANSELAVAMTQLRQTQAELVQSGKMAALGAMVAGVAHEMNTPVGNARLAATTLVHQADRLTATLESGKVSRAELTQCALSLREGADLIDKSLERASNLVRSFKQVAVDQTSHRRRSFYIDEVIHENQLLLTPRLNKAGISVTLECPAQLEMLSYPGDFGQVLTNLMENAMAHAYAGQTSGNVRVRVIETPPGRVRLTVQDFGAGIAAQSLPRIFDPFFTTRMGQGGSGLGLSIVYAMVTKTLGGTIAVESTVGEGTVFTLDLPKNSPQGESDGLEELV